MIGKQKTAASLEAGGSPLMESLDVRPVARGLLKSLISRRSLVFTSDDLDGIIKRVFGIDGAKGLHGVIKRAFGVSGLRKKVLEALDKRLEPAKLTIVDISGRGSAVDRYVIATVGVPLQFADSLWGKLVKLGEEGVWTAQFIKSLMDALIENGKEEAWTEVVSRELEEWYIVRRFHGPAYVYVVLARAWGVDFSEEIVWDSGEATNVKRLCLDDVCIFLNVSDGRDREGFIYKSLWYDFMPTSPRPGENEVHQDDVE